MKHFAFAVLCCAITAAHATGAAAQTVCGSMAECPAVVMSATTARQEATVAGVNALLGGATAAIYRLAHGESPWGAFWKGALGGGLIYAGKRVTVEPFDGAGLAGREVASVGGSMVRNASAGRGLLDRVVLPLGPVRLYIGEGPVRARLDLATVMASAVFVGRYGARWDPSASLSAGALIFRAKTPTPGLTAAGATALWDHMPASEGPRLMAHERVHILQYDQSFLSWGQPLERWALDRGPAGAFFRHVDVGGTALAIRSGAALAFDYRSRPWEWEAYFLSQRVYPAH